MHIRVMVIKNWQEGQYVDDGVRHSEHQVILPSLYISLECQLIKKNALNRFCVFVVCKTYMSIVDGGVRHTSYIFCVFVVS